MVYPDQSLLPVRKILITTMAVGLSLNVALVVAQTEESQSVTWKNNQLEVGVSTKVIQSLKAQGFSTDIHKSLHVRLAASPSVDVLGKAEFQQQHNQLIFRPRFAFAPGTKLEVRLGTATDPIVIIKYVVPRSRPAKPPQLTQILPSANKLPANLLKFYLHFSTPMRQGNIYRHFSIRDLQSGQSIELPFLELEQELWSRDRLRLTLFFDPGRIKRGLKPREEMGAIFLPGRKYEFRISGQWTSEEGVPLGQDISKTFEIQAEDHTTPDVKNWKLTVPEKGTTSELIVVFDEGLDSALAKRVLRVQLQGKEIEMKKIALGEREQSIRMTPAHPWQSGQYSLLVGNEIEDLCGNRVGKPFDVDLKKKPARSNDQPLKLPFEVSDASGK